MPPERYEFLDFFAGSGLVSEGVKPYFHTAWANDISQKKADVYLANQDPAFFHPGPLQDFTGQDIPEATVSWASFPCQDLSLAGKQQGINGERSGLVWTWLRLMDEMATQPPIIVAENVAGLTSSNNGGNYRVLHQALTARKYRVGPIQLDALQWLPQSRKRIFVIGVRRDINLDGLIEETPNWLHPADLRRAIDSLSEAVWWTLPQPQPRTLKLSDIVEYNAPFNIKDKTTKLILLIPPSHVKKMQTALSRGVKVFPGYKRVRDEKQVLEIRTDDISGCLRTAHGGSSREFLVISVNGILKTRLLTVRETARLMGVPDSYKIPGDYNSGYNAMGDAVALPVTQYLTEHLLLPLARRVHANNPRIFAGIQEAIR